MRHQTHARQTPIQEGPTGSPDNTTPLPTSNRWPLEPTSCDGTNATYSERNQLTPRSTIRPEGHTLPATTIYRLYDLKIGKLSPEFRQSCFRSWSSNGGFTAPLERGSSLQNWTLKPVKRGFESTFIGGYSKRYLDLISLSSFSANPCLFLEKWFSKYSSANFSLSVSSGMGIFTTR